MARPKICQPRFCSAQLASADEAPRRIRACAASGTARPASQRNSGAPMPVTGAVQQVLRMAEAMGLGPAELSAVVSLMTPHRRESFLAQAQQG